jgi:hypothetical protein
MPLLKIKETSKTDIHGLGSWHSRDVNGSPLAWPRSELTASALPFIS